jgi:hypothetical protein
MLATTIAIEVVIAIEIAIVTKISVMTEVVVATNVAIISPDRSGREIGDKQCGGEKHLHHEHSIAPSNGKRCLDAIASPMARGKGCMPATNVQFFTRPCV